LGSGLNIVGFSCFINSYRHLNHGMVCPHHRYLVLSVLTLNLYFCLPFS
jgi:hypothetical protein